MPVDLDQVLKTSWMTTNPTSIDFPLPKNLEAGEPPERLWPAARPGAVAGILLPRPMPDAHHFSLPGGFPERRRRAVINTSGTLNAAMPALRQDGTRLERHLSTHLPSDMWVVELRR